MLHCRHAVAVAVTALRLAKNAFVAKQTPEHAQSVAQALTRLTSLLGSSPDKDSQAQALSGAVKALKPVMSWTSQSSSTCAEYPTHAKAGMLRCSGKPARRGAGGAGLLQRAGAAQC